MKGGRTDKILVVGLPGRRRSKLNVIIKIMILVRTF